MLSKTIILDIEGTTTPISFVADILFPFAAEQFGSFLEANWDNPKIGTEIDALYNYETQTNPKTLQTVVRIARDLIDRDVKLTALKSLQGKIWRAGYEDGNLRGELFEDVADCLIEWAKTHRLFIYSSGSVEAQKLLFGFSNAGDLRPHIEGYFDTKIGSKKVRESYEAIAEHLKCSCSDLYFLTDSEIEAGCATDAGWNVILMTRPGNAPLVDPKVEALTRCDTFHDVATVWGLNRT